MPSRVALFGQRPESPQPRASDLFQRDERAFFGFNLLLTGCGIFWAKLFWGKKADSMLRKIKALKGDRRGVTMLEYAFIAVLVAIAAVTLLSSIGTQLSSMFSKVNSTYST
jgi:pilus assembly protein Flp/PilA